MSSTVPPIGMKKLLTTTAGAAFMALSAVGATQAATVTIGNNFTASTFINDKIDPQTNTDFIPPDANGAFGAGKFTEFINNQFSVYQPDGNLLQRKSAYQFWTDAGVTFPATVPSNLFLFDPRILYDPSSNRWFAAQRDNPAGKENQSNDLLVAVSSSSDPTGTWNGFLIPNTQNVVTDFPTLGLNADGVYLASNNFSLTTGEAQSLSILSIPKADLLSATPTVANKTFFQTVDPNQYGFTIQPAVDFGPSGSPEALLAVDFNTFNVFRRSSVFGADGDRATLSAPVQINNVPFDDSFPPPASQPDGSRDLDTGDNRFSSSIYKVGNSLWAVNSFEDRGRAAIGWYEIDATSNQLLQSGKIGDADHDYFYPSIAVNQFGDAVIGFTRSGPTEFASSYAVVGETINNITTFGTPILLKAGVDNYHLTLSGSVNRWGDYSATTINPDNPNDFWTIQEFASGKDSLGEDTWSTQVTELLVNFPEVPEPTSVLGSLLFSALGVGSMLKRQHKQKP